MQYARKRGRQIIPCLLSDTEAWKPSDWLELVTANLVYIQFHSMSESDIHEKARELIDQITEPFLIPHYTPSKTVDKASYLFELIRYEYERHSRIERFMDPSISFPIEQSYINLAIVKAEEQREKEKQLRDAQHATDIMGTYEDIYGTKTAINVKDIFETCKSDEKKVLVFGRAGIGKSTFCRHIAYQWATGSYWSQYELLALIPLRRLTTHRYSPDKSYSLLDIVKKEIFSFDLSEKEEELLKNQFDARKILWILDGYDEIVQNVLPHLQYLFDKLLKTPHHIITSRPYLNTLSYDIQMEITGFTDENIENYVQNFFDQMKNELANAAIKSQRLLKFFKSNPNIWGVAHIPVNLELICSLWSNKELSETEQLTMTTLYTMMTEWICRRYLRTQDNQILQLSEEEVHERCQQELVFLENLAFNAMESNTIIIRPAQLKQARNAAKISSQEHAHILNIGILKSFRKQGIGNLIEMNKDHYFVHLSFQEYFAARYLINALRGSQTEKAIEFIKYQKYNQRYTLVFSFVAGLLSENEPKPCSDIFWNTILREPLDLVGIRHMQLLISCMQETTGKSTAPRRSELLESIANCIKYSFTKKSKIIRQHLLQSFQRVQSITSDPKIINMMMDLLQHRDIETKKEVLLFIANLRISNPSNDLITSVTIRLEDEDVKVRENACDALGEMGEKAATNEVINKLVSALGDESERVRRNACEALRKMGEKAATNEVITKLVSALGDESNGVRWHACDALGKIGEKEATNEVITKLMSALGDESDGVRWHACIALGKMGEKEATNEVITKLVSALGDKSDWVKWHACEALRKIGEKAATNKVIAKLVSALGDESDRVRASACEALGKMGEKAATNEVITKLVSALGDESEGVRESVCEALENIGEKAATNEVIIKLVSALGDESYDVREAACYALGKMGEKAATNEVITKLVSALGDERKWVRKSACEALGNIGEKAATNEVITKLVSALGDESNGVRWHACYALGKMGEKAATTEVITKLVNALGDERKWVRKSACIALGNIGEKAATNEVITKLMNALGDESEGVRESVCEALGKMGEKAATNEVITKLVNVLGDESELVGLNACSALGKMGEKAATNEVITKLVSMIIKNSNIGGVKAVESIENILSSSAVVRQIDPGIIADLCRCRNASDCLKNISDEELIRIFLTTENPDWLCVVTRFALLRGVAVTGSEEKVVIFGEKEPLELRIRTPQLWHQLLKAFTDQKKRLHLQITVVDPPLG